MSIEQILDYQKLDRELFKIEKQLRENSNKQKANEMYDNMRNAQSRSVKLEEKAGIILAEIDKIKKQYKIQEAKMNEFLSKDLLSLSKDDVEKLSVLKDKLSQNLVILDKNLTALAENVNAVLSDFNKTIKVFNNSKEIYAKCKQAYDDEVSKFENDKKQIVEKLEKLSKSVDGKVMDAYSKRRKENIFPVMVPLVDNSCGGCRYALSSANILKLEEDGISTCEHCHRIVYKK